MFYDEDSAERWEEDAWDAYCDDFEEGLEQEEEEKILSEHEIDLIQERIRREIGWREFWDLPEDELKTKYPDAPPPQTMFKYPEFWRVMPDWVFDALVVNYIPPEEPY